MKLNNGIDLGQTKHEPADMQQNKQPTGAGVYLKDVTAQ